MKANKLIGVIKTGLGSLNNQDLDIKINGNSIKDACVIINLDDPNPDSIDLVILEEYENK